MPTRGKDRRIVFSEEEIAYMREAYKTESCGDIADKLGVSSQTISTYAREHGFERAPEWSKKNYYGRYTKNYKHYYKPQE